MHFLFAWPRYVIQKASTCSYRTKKRVFVKYYMTNCKMWRLCTVALFLLDSLILQAVCIYCLNKHTHSATFLAFHLHRPLQMSLLKLESCYKMPKFSFRANTEPMLYHDMLDWWWFCVYIRIKLAYKVKHAWSLYTRLCSSHCWVLYSHRQIKHTINRLKEYLY